MHRPERTIVCGNPESAPPPLLMLNEVERLMTFAVSAECVGRPPAVPTNGSKNMAASDSGPRSYK